MRAVLTVKLPDADHGWIDFLTTVLFQVTRALATKGYGRPAHYHGDSWLLLIEEDDYKTTIRPSRSAAL